MATSVLKLFRRPEDAKQAVSDLKAKGYEAVIIERSGEKELEGIAPSDEAVDYYRMGLSLGGKIVKASVDDAKVDEVNKILLAAGFDELTARPAQWSSSPGFVQAQKMSATNPVDAVMTGDFRTY